MSVKSAIYNVEHMKKYKLSINVKMAHQKCKIQS